MKKKNKKINIFEVLKSILTGLYVISLTFAIWISFGASLVYLLKNFSISFASTLYYLIMWLISFPAALTLLFKLFEVKK